MPWLVGFDKPLYVLPFDHRATFYNKMFGRKETPTPEQTAQIADPKQVICDGFQAGKLLNEARVRFVRAAALRGQLRKADITL